jgi:hypothetical protein
MATYNKPASSTLNGVWAATGNKTPAPSASKISEGWTPEIPPHEYFNYLDNKQDAALAHINQRGIPQWDNTGDYIGGLSYVAGSNGIIYYAILSSNAGSPINPVGDVTGTWRVAFYFSTDVYTKTESDNKYTWRANNLSDLANTATARNNISVYSKAETDAKYLVIANNLSDVNAATARNNISTYSKAETDAKYLIATNNLSDVNAATARSNLGVASVGENLAFYAARSANLSDLASIPTSRTNLDVWSKGEADGRYLTLSGNLSGIASPSAAFDNIKQGATDSYVGVSQFATDVEVNNGVVANKSIAPSKLKAGFDVSLGINGYLQLPTWLLSVRIEWGRASVNSTAPHNVTLSFPNNCYVFIPTLSEAPDQALIATGGSIVSKTLAQIHYFHANTAKTSPFMWIAIGN